MTELEMQQRQKQFTDRSTIMAFRPRFLDWSATRVFASKNLKIALRYPFNMVFWGLLPIFWLAPYLLMMIAIAGPSPSRHFTELSGFNDFVRFALIGWFVYQYVDNAIWGIGNNFRWEQFSGTLEPLFIAPVPRTSILLGGAFSDTVETSVSAVILLISTAILFGVEYSLIIVAPAIILILLMLFALFGFGFMVAGLILVFKDPSVLSQLVDNVVFTITPVNYPVKVLPRPAQFAAYLIPATIAMETLRVIALTETFEIISFLQSLLFLGGLIVLFWILGILAFRYAEKWTKTRGHMGGF